MKMNYAQLLDRVKEEVNTRDEASPGKILLLEKDASLIRTIAGWVEVNPTYDPLASAPDFDLTTSFNDAWQWLWNNTEFSQEQLDSVLGVFSGKGERKLNRAKHLHAIFPDGTLPQVVRIYLTVKSREVLGLPAQTGAVVGG